MNEHAPFAVQLTRTFPVSIDRLYAAWTDSSLLRQWWGPTGFTCPIAEMEVRAGGVSIVAMRAPAGFGGAEFVNSWTYAVVEPLVRLEFDSRFVDRERRPITPAEAGIPGAVPDVVPHTLTFGADGNSSTLSVQERGYPDAGTRDMSLAGMAQSLDKLERALIDINGGS